MFGRVFARDTREEGNDRNGKSRQHVAWTFSLYYVMPLNIQQEAWEEKNRVRSWRDVVFQDLEWRRKVGNAQGGSQTI